MTLVRSHGVGCPTNEARTIAFTDKLRNCSVFFDIVREGDTGTNEHAKRKREKTEQHERQLYPRPVKNAPSNDSIFFVLEMGISRQTCILRPEPDRGATAANAQAINPTAVGTEHEKGRFNRP